MGDFLVVEASEADEESDKGASAVNVADVGEIFLGCPL